MEIDPNLLQQFALRLRSYAKASGTGCSLPGCDALTLGVRCEQCARIICATHTYWSLAWMQAVPYCPYCVLQQNPALFSDADDADETTPDEKEPEIIDGEFDEK